MSELCNEYMNSYGFLQIHENPDFNKFLHIHEIPARLKQAIVFEYFPSNRFFVLHIWTLGIDGKSGTTQAGSCF